MWGRKNKNELAPSPDEITAMLPPIAQSLIDAASRAGRSPTDMQSNFWNQALHGR
jgi:hypothetical protein